MYNRNKSDFSAYYKLNTPINILLSNNSSIQVTHYGMIYIQNLQIDALYTPTLRDSLLSIGELNNQGKITIFGNNRCIIYNHNTVLITGTKNGKMFQVNTDMDT